MAVALPNTRGSWTLDEAVAYRWDEAGLDTIVRNEWPITERLSTKYQPLNDDYAHPTPPGPYVVFEMGTPIVMGHMSGARGGQRENQLQAIMVQFSIHAQSKEATSTTLAESAKSVCVRLAKQIAAAFDPDTHPWTMNDDKMVLVKRGPDFHVREGDDEWVWVLQYDVMLDAEYMQA